MVCNLKGPCNWLNIGTYVRVPVLNNVCTFRLNEKKKGPVLALGLLYDSLQWL